MALSVRGLLLSGAYVANLPILTIMGLSIKDMVALLEPEEREAWVASLPLSKLEEIARDEWWYTGREEQILDEGQWFVACYLAGRGSGKAIDVDECVPTPEGYRRFGDLTIGDQVFDEHGQPCHVLATYDYTPQKAYRLTFSDHTYIDTCGDHQWVTWTHSARKAYLRSEYVKDKTTFPANWTTWRPYNRYKDNDPVLMVDGPGPRMLTTQQLVDTFTYGKRKDRNHCIPTAGPLQLPEVDLPVDPWVLGYWLGNGSHNSGQVCGHGEDEGYVRTRLVAGDNYNEGTEKTAFAFTVLGLLPLLRQLGVLGNKHIPDAYLWASEKQRSDLLAGLLDSDGYLDPVKSTVEFCSMTEDLAVGVLQLARSLGQKPVLKKGRATLYGVDHGVKFRVTWRPTTNPFGSPRKRAAWTPLSAQSLRFQRRMITHFEPIAPIPMRCITVDSPNSMYLIGEAMIPTHNSRSGSEWMVDRALRYPLDKSGVPTEHMVIAETLSDARIVNVEGPSGLLNVLNRRQLKYRYFKAPKPMIVFPNDVKIHTSGADNPDTARGMNLASALLDEVIKWKAPRQTWLEGIMPALRADLPGDHPRAFITTTPKPIDLLFELSQRVDGSVHMIRGSTFDNAANLSGHVLKEMKLRYDGTTLGRQELYGELIDAADGTIFGRGNLEMYRVDDVPDNIINTVVGVDPGSTGEGDETGIVVVARDVDNHLYILADHTVRAAGRPAAMAVWRAMLAWGGDQVIVEDNVGKRWLTQVLEDAFIELRDKQGLFDMMHPPLHHVDSRHGKSLRAQPVGMRLEQGRLHMVGRAMEALENQMVSFDPDVTNRSRHDSPDRVDAMVHACRHLMKAEKKRASVADPGQYKLDRSGDFYGISFLG